MLRSIIMACAAGAWCCAQEPHSNPVRDQYNRTYASPDEQHTFNHEPNAFLTTVLRDTKPGKAVDVGMGQGRNAIWLARRGWHVTGFDLSDVGVKLAKEQAEAAGVRIDALVASTEEFDFGVDRWDLIVLTYVPFNPYRDKLIQALRPGGLILVEAFHNDTRRVRLLGDGFNNNELLQAFPGLRILHYEDTWAKQDWGARSDGPYRPFAFSRRSLPNPSRTAS